MTHSPEPWFIWIGVGRVLIFDAQNAGDDADNRPVAAVDINDYDQLEDAKRDADRIVACVNFCRQFSTEYLTDRQLVYLKPGDELIGKSLNSIEGFDGLVAVSLIPAQKIPTQDEGIPKRFPWKST